MRPSFKNVKFALKKNNFYKFRIVTGGEKAPSGSELYENNKLSNGEVLSFKSKNNAIEPYSGLWIRTPNNKLMISSLPNTSNWIELDLSQQILKNRKNGQPRSCN